MEDEYRTMRNNPISPRATLHRNESNLGALGGNHPDDTWKNAYFLSTTIDA